MRSLALHEILEQDLERVLKRAQPTSLTSLTVKTKHAGYRPAISSVDAISSVIASSCLQRLEMAIRDDHVKYIRWPKTSTIKQLKLNAELSMNELCTIVDRLPHLQVLLIGNIRNDSSNNQMGTEKFRQLTSLTIERFYGLIDELEYLLSLTSSLRHLKLVGRGDLEDMGDGKRWEQFIQLNLPYLTTFEFSLWIRITNSPTCPNIDSILSTFRSSFWLEQKKWIVRDDRDGIVYDVFNACWLKLYSLPICIDTFLCQMKKEGNNMSCASVENPLWMDNVTTLSWFLNRSVSTIAEDQVRIQDKFELPAAS